MPELAEVERAKNDCKAAVEGKYIANIRTKEDTIVYANSTHEEFANAVRGKLVQRVGRLGKYFYLVMQTAPHIVLHLGMAGFVSTRGKEPLFYRRKAKNWKNDDGSDWPLRYWKFALTMSDTPPAVTASGTSSPGPVGPPSELSEWCFCDSRRLGRIKLVYPPEDEPEKPIEQCVPLSELGRDPYLDMPSLDELSTAILKRKAPIKALLLNQNGPLCGIGNWLVDEILYQSAIHPAQRCNTLTTSQLLTLHTQIQAVVNKAVEVNADHSKFPKHWLFKYRWGKGRASEPKTFLLPDGSTATVTHMTVGGRTSAIVESVQKLLGEEVASGDEEEGGENGENEDGADPDTHEDVKPKRKARAKKEAASKITIPVKARGRKRKHATPTPSPVPSDAESDLTALGGSDAEEKPLKRGRKANVVQISPKKVVAAKCGPRAKKEEVVAEIDKVEITRPAAAEHKRQAKRGRRAVKAEK